MTADYLVLDKQKGEGAPRPSFRAISTFQVLVLTLVTNRERNILVYDTILQIY